MLIDSKENKRKILNRFLEICALEGANDNVLEEAMSFCEIDPKFKNIIFEQGILSLIEFFIDEINKNLSKIIAQNKDFDNLKIREKIRFALYKLFESQQNQQLAIEKIKDFYFDFNNFTNKNYCKKYGARPAILAFKNAAKISDHIWSQIGDKSTDYNFYTKRFTLCNIIIASFLIFVKDKTTNLEETKAFIDKKIEKVMKIEKFKAKIKDFSQKTLKNPQNIKDLIKKLPFIRLFKN